LLFHTGQNLDASFHKLHDAENKLKQVVRQKFDEAVRDEDLASVERFFKIFPLLYMHDEGLERFTNYLSFKVKISRLCIIVRASCRHHIIILKYVVYRF